MSSPVRSVVVRLSMDPSSYVAGAAKAEQSTLALDAAAAKAGATSATSMEKAAAGAGTAESSFGKLNKAAGTLGITLGGLAGVGTAVGVALSVKWAGDYESALTRLVTTAGESPAKIQAVGQAFLDMAGQVGISADEIAKGAYTAESAGFHGADAVTVMKAASEGARQENADLGKVVNATTTILHDYHLQASDAATVTSQLITAVSHGKVSFDELTGALDAITPLASRANISIADVTGTLAAMTASGMSADQATQNMQNTLMHLANPTNTMIAELAQLGISTDDLASSLSTKGLAGTLQMVEEAIVNHVDPATQRVLLPALNQSKTAAQDLQIMLGQMPASLKKLSQGFLDGSVSMTDYRKDVRDLGGANEAMGTQFLSLVQSSQGFNNALKSGSPNAQVFTAAMAKAFGTTSALNVALQTTGENAPATNAAIKDIAAASAQADGNIKGWSEVQATFNQQLHEFEAGAKSLAIEAGQHLLPVLTSTFGFVNRDVLPGLKTVGSLVGDVAHWFSELPAPVKDTALAMGALKLAMSINFLGIGTAVTGIKTSFTGLREEMALQQALWGMNERAVAEASASYGEMGAALGLATVSMDEATAGATRLEGAMGTLAARGMAGVKAAGSGVISMLGGPWGIAMLGAVAGLSLYSSGVQESAQQTDKFKQAGADLGATYLKIGNIMGDQGIRARELVREQLDLNELQYQAGISTETMTAALQGNTKAQDEAIRSAGSLHDRWFALGHDLSSGDFGAIFSGKFMSQNAQNLQALFEQINPVATAMGQLNKAMEGTDGGLQALYAAADKVFGKDNLINPEQSGLQKGMAELAGSAGDAEKSMQGITDILKGLTSGTANAADAQAAQTDALDATGHAFDNLAAGAINARGQIDLTTKAGADLYGRLKDLGSGFSDTVNKAYEAAGGVAAGAKAADAAGQAAETLYNRFLLTAKGAGLSDDAAQALAKSLGLVPGDIVTKFTTPGLNAAQAGVRLLQGQVDVITSGPHDVTVRGLTQQAEDALTAVGVHATHLPDGTVKLDAETAAAQSAIDNFLHANAYHEVVVGVAGHVTISYDGDAIRAGGHFSIAEAHGGLIHAFAGGGFEPMSGGQATIVPPNTYRLIGDRVVDDEAYIPINGSARSHQILAAAAARMGYGLASKEQAAPVRTRELVGAGAGGPGAGIDYGRLAAALTVAGSQRPTVGQMIVQKESTAREAVDYLTALARTGH